MLNSIHNILYIYGYGSNPNSNTYSWLKSNFKDKNVVCYWYDQHNPEEAINSLSYIVSHSSDIDLIIGSSLGGWIAMHVAVKASKPCMLINPLTDKNLKKVLFDVSNGDINLVNAYLKYQENYPLFKANENHLEVWDRFENGNLALAILGEEDEVIPKNDIYDHVYKVFYVKNGKHQLADDEKKYFINNAYKCMESMIDTMDNYYKRRHEIIP